MERLTQKDHEYYDCEFMDSGMAEYMNRLAHYEDMEEQGRLVVLPCKVGDVLYDIMFGEVKEKTVVSIAALLSRSVNRITVHASNERGAITEVDMRAIGKTVFLTSEEAERALEGGRSI